MHFRILTKNHPLKPALFKRHPFNAQEMPLERPLVLNVRSMFISPFQGNVEPLAATVRDSLDSLVALPYRATLD